MYFCTVRLLRVSAGSQASPPVPGLPASVRDREDANLSLELEIDYGERKAANETAAHAELGTRTRSKRPCLGLLRQALTRLAHGCDEFGAELWASRLVQRAAASTSSAASSSNRSGLVIAA
jgi:hypothetical protein